MNNITSIIRSIRNIMRKDEGVDDDDLFWEHQIVADLNAKNKLTDINIRG